jgi:polyferredoxin
MRRPFWIPWRWWRRAAQLALLVLFLWLFRRTEYQESVEQMQGGENLLFRLDPLVGVAAMFAGRQFLAAFWPAAVMLALTLVFGRFFCGWVCPLGTLLDSFHFVLRPITGRTNHWLAACTQASPESQNSRGPTARGRTIPYVLLIAVLFAAVFAFPLVGFVDPFALLVRGLTFWGDPVLYRGVNAGLRWIGDGRAANAVALFVRRHLLPFGAMTFDLAGVSAAILAVIFALELVARRFWCRYVCPAGAMFGLVAHQSLLKRTPATVCRSCSRCATACRMGALDPATGYASEACNRCMDCIDDCPKGIVGFRFAWRRRKGQASKRVPQRVDLSRRGLLVGVVAGAGIPGVASLVRWFRPSAVDPTLLRPPGAEDEKTFLALCVRCGECMKVCQTNVLQPAMLQSGMEGMFSPRLDLRIIPEQSYCEYNCTLCGQVCPTGAIPRLTVEAKHEHPTGKAYFDHSRCLPWAEQTPCICCQEMCPTPEKAIKILKMITIKDKDGEEIEIMQPYVDRQLCVGCGICEAKCPLPGAAGIHVRRVDAPDPGTEFRLGPPSDE